MDDLDRLHRRLVHNIRATRPEYLQIPFTVRDLYERIVPYRHNRRELAIETNDDYETAVARLLSGERGYVQADPAMQEALRRELASPTGDPGLFKEYADASVSLPPASESARTPPPAAIPARVNTPPRAAAPAAAPAAARSTPSSAPPQASPPTAASAAVPARAQPSQPMEIQRAAHRPSAAAQAVTAAFDAMGAATTTPAAPHAPVPTLLDSLSHIDMPTGCRFCGGTLPEGRESNYCPHCGENLRTKRCPACGSEMDTSWAYCVTCGRRAG